ncbi:uncharacterized protein LOC111941255 isoform X2 [Cyanistes caeruleus]|uniref:uncharacterized protein LOC111941255 isoform X2 n=1 Tax=Cyanistes caeruleus TaxID=156563 RepID=UPI000CDA44B2|nr:uncharacterized protein LOC111941255 isoform X2 [Cyanistes caeruleus]
MNQNLPGTVSYGDLNLNLNSNSKSFLFCTGGESKEVRICNEKFFVYERCCHTNRDYLFTPSAEEMNIGSCWRRHETRLHVKEINESLNIQVHKGRSLKIKHPFLKLRIRKVSRLGPSQHAKHPEAKKQFTAHRLHRTEEHRGNIESLFLLGKKIKPAKTFLSFDGHFLRVVVSLPAADVGDTENKKAKIKFTLKIK